MAQQRRVWRAPLRAALFTLLASAALLLLPAYAITLRYARVALMPMRFFASRQLCCYALKQQAMRVCYVKMLIRAVYNTEVTHAGAGY